jgi:succinyl-CoA synthetase alpha subunit
MVILIDSDTKAIVQGMTGTQGSFHTKLMLNYGTRIVAGVTPGKGGFQVEGIPVYDTVNEALHGHEADASIIFVPAPGVKDAVLEAIGSGLKLLVIITECVPMKDAMEFLWEAERSSVRVIGPNTPGVITPNECKLGIMPSHVFKKGRVGVVSRSGTLTYEVSARLTQSGLGQSTCLGLGGDALVGLTFVEALEMFKNDRETDAVALIGEIGGNAEELAAEYIKATGYPKPVVAYVVGRSAPPGKRMGHAGAIIMGRTGTAESKIKAFESAGVDIAEMPNDVARILKERLA